jgi:hypothetical protein
MRTCPACASCRLSRDVLADFDHVDVVDIHDGARIRALVDTARQMKAHSGTRIRAARSQQRLRFAAAAAALLVGGGSASATVWWLRQPAPPPAVASPPAVAARQPAPAPAREPARQHLAAPVATPAEAAPPRARLLARHAGAAQPSSGDGVRPSATALLAEAGRARGEGQLDRAASLYRRLQREFPGTPEALVSTVPLGRLLLDGGSARAALAAFDGYLRGMPRGPLVAEALYGKGRALEALGDGVEERRTWERLVTEHAGSAYAPPRAPPPRRAQVTPPTARRGGDRAVRGARHDGCASGTRGGFQRRRPST